MAKKQPETKPYRDIDIGPLEYYIGDRRWKIKPDGHAVKNTDIITKMMDDFTKVANSPKSKPKDKEIADRKLTKEILEFGLVNFDFDKECESLSLKQLGAMAIEVYTFLVEIGGKEEYLLLKQQLKDTSNISDGSETSKKDSK